MNVESIIEGSIVTPGGVFYRQVLVSESKIKDVGKGFGNPHHKFGKTTLIFPGFVDIHVHAREDESGEQNYKEDFQTVSQGQFLRQPGRLAARKPAARARSQQLHRDASISVGRERASGNRE